MKAKLLTGLFAAATTLGGLLAGASSAAAFTWDNSWQQPTILGKSQTKFDDQPFQMFVQRESLAIDENELAAMESSGKLPYGKPTLLDPAKLKFKFDHNVSVYFINEGAAYRNQLAYEAALDGKTTTGLIFNDVSSTESILRESNGPLKKGDSVNLGTIKRGTQLDFWLRSNGYSGGRKLYSTKEGVNPDGLNHVVAYAYNNYLMLGFEDLYGPLGKGSDRDFNDTVFVVDVGKDNLHAMQVPEPSLTLALVGLGAAGVFKLRRRKEEDPAS